MMIEDEAAIEEQAAVCFDRASHDICGVGVRPSICGWPGPAFGIRFNDDAGEVGNGCLTFVRLLLPPCSNARIERIERVQITERLGATEVHGQHNLDAPGP